MKELERRKRCIGLQLSLSTGDDYLAKIDELHDIDRQLVLIRDRADYHDLTYQKHLAHKETEDKFIEAYAKTEAEVFRLASEYQAKTLGTLMRILAEKRCELTVEANKPNRLRMLMSPFNIWPLNQICRMPLEEVADGKPL